MNCSMCQEKLDERLDQLRANVQDGTVSRAEARAQGMAALREVAGECAECEHELHTHLNLRLAFLSAEPEPVTLPPEFRANVRRALERESASPSTSWGRRPWTNFAWTGGAMLSAIGLFVIARPFLMEQAQKPPTAPASSAAETATNETEAVLNAPQILPSATPARGRTNQEKRRALVAPPKARPLAKTPTSSDSNSASSPTLAPPSPQPTARVAAPSTPRFVVPPVVSPPAPPSPVNRSSAPSGGSGGNANAASSNALATASKTSPQNGLRFSRTPAANSQVLSGQTVPEASASLNDSANTGKPRLGAPAEPQLDTNALAPTGEELGLKVRVVPIPARRNAVVGGFGGGFGNGGFGGGGFRGNEGAGNFGGGVNARAGGFGEGNLRRRQGEPGDADTGAPPAGPVVPPATQNGSPQRSEALESRGARNDGSNAAPNGVKAPSPAFVAPAPSKNVNGASNVFAAPAAPKNNAPASSEANRGQSKVAQGLFYDNDLAAQTGAPSPSVLVSVASPVVNARIKGRIKDRNDQDVLLWSGDIAAKQSVSVSLIPLGALKGDEVYISIEQQISLGQNRKLATTSVVVP